jgi:hypothetical protein
MKWVLWLLLWLIAEWWLFVDIPESKDEKWFCANCWTWNPSALAQCSFCRHRKSPGKRETQP